LPLAVGAIIIPGIMITITKITMETTMIMITIMETITNMGITTEVGDMVVGINTIKALLQE